MQKIALILLVLCVFGQKAKAEIILTDATPGFAVSNVQYYYTENEGCSWSLQDTMMMLWVVPKENIHLHAAKEGTCYWLRLDVLNHSNTTRWTIEGMDIRLKNLSFYLVQNGKLIQSGEMGVTYPFHQRSYQTTNFAIDLDVPLGESRQVYLKLWSDNQASFSFHLRKSAYYVSYAVHEFFALGAFYGILLIIALYNLLVFIASKERMYLYYVFYVLGCVLYSFEESGYGFKFLWPNHPEWNESMDYFVGPLFFLWSYTVYSLNFLDLHTYLGKQFKWLLIVVACLSGYLVVEFFLPFNLPTFNIFILPFFLIYFLSIYIYFLGNKYSRYFILGNSFVLLSMLINLGRNYGWWPHNLFTVYAFNYGVVLEVVTLSLALGDKIKLITKEHNKAKNALIIELEKNQLLQRKVQNELEAKVTERTLQLQRKTTDLIEANEQLERLTADLNTMNSKLDYDNWSLNRKVKEQKVALFLGENITKEHFFELFPSELDCFKFLEDLKWNKEYVCRKCGGANFTLQENRTHKCTKCKHIESVTAHTLFHGIRFPLSKALYMSYIIYHQPSITIDMLMKSLDLGKNTCWKFKNKVLDNLSKAQEIQGRSASNWVFFLLNE